MTPKRTSNVGESATVPRALPRIRIESELAVGKSVQMPDCSPNSPPSHSLQCGNQAKSRYAAYKRGGRSGPPERGGPLAGPSNQSVWKPGVTRSGVSMLPNIGKANVAEISASSSPNCFELEPFPAKNVYSKLISWSSRCVFAQYPSPLGWMSYGAG